VLRDGSLIWANIPDDPKKEPRACVVTCAPPYSSTVVEVVYGQENPYGAYVYRVEKESELGRLLHLKKPTHFCVRIELYVSLVTEVKKGTCPVLDFLALQKIAEAQRLI
jgi:hypothetical protein